MDLYYQEVGRGFPIVMLHGFPFDHSIFLQTADRLAASARVILPDLRGFGKSAAAAGEITMNEMALDVLELLDDLHIEKAIIAGHSMGGYVSLVFCHEFQSRVAGLALIASHSSADTPERKQGRLINIAKIQDGGSVEYLKEGMAPQLTKNLELRQKICDLMLKTPRASLIGALQGMAERADATDWVKEFHMPVAVIAGNEDMIVPIEKVADMVNLIPEAFLVKIPGAGHMPMLEAPDLTAEGLIRLLRKME